MRKDLQAKAVAPEPEAKPEAADEEGEDGKEVALLAEMSTLKEAADRRMKKEKKRKREAKTKARVRAAQMALGATMPAPPLCVVVIRIKPACKMIYEMLSAHLNTILW